jgi:predicted metalloendopeptidase
MLHEKESCTHIKHVPQNILHLIDETLYEKESHSCVQIPFRFFQNQIDKMLHDEKESCTHIKHVPQNILHLIDETLYEKESHSCVQIPFRFFQNHIDKMLHDEKESSTHVHTFHRNVSFTKVLPGSQSSRSI